MRAGTRPTIQDVARQAGVALGTVSRVINGHANVGADVRARVLQAIAALGYQPNSAAQSMRTRATRLIGCLVPDIRNPLYASVLGAAEAVLSPAGYMLLVAGTGEDAARELQLIQAFARYRVDGMLAVPADERRDDLQAAYRALRTPIVLLERDLPLPLSGIVATDQASSIQAATAMLLDLGHRRIALLTSPAFNRSGRERISGYRAAFAERGLAMDEALVHQAGQSTEAAQALLQPLLSGPDRVTAVITGGDRTLGGVLRAIREARRRIPADVSVVAWGDSDLAEFADPPLTVIRYDAAQTGREAGRILLDALAEPERKRRPRRMLVPAELVMRASCARPG